MKMSHCLSALALTAMFLSAPAFARDPINGTVYRTTNDGVYLQTSQGVTFVPNRQGNFRVGNTVIGTNKLVKGRPYKVYYGDNYTPEYIPTEYYRAHQEWDWSQNQKGWKKDRTVWVRQSDGSWRKRQANR